MLCKPLRDFFFGLWLLQHGWALSNAAIEVAHVVRKEGLSDTDTVDLLDLRSGYSKHAWV